MNATKHIKTVHIEFPQARVDVEDQNEFVLITIK